MTIFARILTGAASLALVAGAAAPAAAQPAPYGGYQDPYYGGGGVGAAIGQILGGGRYGTYGQGRDRVAVDQCARAAEVRASRDYRPGGYGAQQPYNVPQGYGDPRYGQGYPGQPYGYQVAAQARVIGITNVERRSSGVKVSGVMDSGRSRYRGQYGGQAYGYGGQGYPNQGYGQAYPNQAYPNQGYPNQAYPNQAYPGYGNAYGRATPVADLRFSCRVDFRGYVTDVDIRRNVAARRGY